MQNRRPDVGTACARGFLFLKPAEAAVSDAGPEIVVVLNFSEELRRLAPPE